MTKKLFTISASGLQKVVFSPNDGSDNFRFIFGDKEVQMNSFLADFISPRVSRIHQIDPTIDSIFLNNFTDETNNNPTIFNDSELITNFKQISMGRSVEIDEEMSYKMRFLSILIDNGEIFNGMGELFPIDIENPNFEKIDQILLFANHNCDTNGYCPTFDINEIFDVMASNFYQIEDKLLKLPKKIIHSVISNKNLKIKDEDSLFEFINKIFSPSSSGENEDEIMNFYEVVELCNLSEDKFNEFIDKFSPDDITYQIWEKLKNCFYYRFILNQSKEKSINDRYVNVGKEILYDSNNRFKGIITYLGNGNSKTVIDNKIVEFTSSSCAGNSHLPSFAADYENNNYFHSNYDQNEWLCFDFKERKVKPSHYSLKSYADSKNYYNIQNWCIEGSNDNKSWKVLDERIGDKSLDDTNASNTFEIQKKLGPYDFYRYLRIRQTGENTKGNDYRLIIRYLEYFGHIKEP